MKPSISRRGQARSPFARRLTVLSLPAVAMAVMGLAVAAPAQAAPSRTRATTATTVPVAVAWGNELASLLGVYNTLYYNHQVLWERLSGLETMCQDAQGNEAALPAVANAEWDSLAGGVKNNYNYFDHVIDPALNRLKSGAAKLKAQFAKKFTARKAFLLGVGTDYIEAGVAEWRKADLLAAHGELALNLHSCAPGEQLFDQANQVLLLSLDDMEAGREQLVKLF